MKAYCANVMFGRQVAAICYRGGNRQWCVVPMRRPWHWYGTEYAAVEDAFNAFVAHMMNNTSVKVRNTVRGGKDSRYMTVRNLITAGYVTLFREMFDVLPKSVVARDMGMNNVRFSRMLSKLEDWKIREILVLARLIKVDYMVVIRLLHAEREAKLKAQGVTYGTMNER